MAITISGSGTMQQMASGGITGGATLTAMTAQASTSGTSIDFTSIPSWAKRITVMFNAISTNGTSQVIVRLGISTGVETTGYQSAASNTGDVVTSTVGIVFSDGSLTAAASAYTGVLSFVLITTNTWVVDGCCTKEGNNNGSIAGAKTLAGTLDRVRITTTNGTDTFDAGTINVLYE
jgi:hypothetical protein